MRLMEMENKGIVMISTPRGLNHFYEMFRRLTERLQTDGWKRYREAERRVLNPYHPHKITEIVTMPDGAIKITRHWRD